MDILQEKPYIDKVIAVSNNTLRQTTRKLSVNGRLSDAFVYILSGSCEYTFQDGEKFTVQDGDLLYLADSAVYEMKLQTEAYVHIYVNFRFGGENKYNSRVYKGGEQAYLWQFKKLHLAYKGESEKSKIECMRRLYEIYETIFELNERRYVPKTLKEKMEKSKEYIHLHYDDGALSVSRLAEFCGMSEVYFRKLFQSVYKLSPKKYMTKVRLEKAIEAMNYSFLSLEECALSCGFSSLPYFVKVFKNELGETPAAYRKKRNG